MMQTTIERTIRNGRKGEPQVRLALVILPALLSTSVAFAQETIAVAIDGWRHQSSSDGINSYRCASSNCAAGSTVSYKMQPHRPAVTLDDFERHHRALADANRGSRRINEVRISHPQTRIIEGVRVVQIEREVDWTDAKTTYTIEARLIGPDRSYSLVSDSSKREWTVNNFEGFLRNIVIIAGIREP